MTIAFGTLQVLDDRQSHGFRCTKTKATRIADIQRNDLVPTPLHLVRAIREPSANFVANTAERGAGFEGK
jgi:hypothetical protein